MEETIRCLGLGDDSPGAFVFLRKDIWVKQVEECFRGVLFKET